MEVMNKEGMSLPNSLKHWNLKLIQNFTLYLVYELQMILSTRSTSNMPKLMVDKNCRRCIFWDISNTSMCGFIGPKACPFGVGVDLALKIFTVPDGTKHGAFKLSMVNYAT